MADTNNFNLDDASDGVDFVLCGKEFHLRYPTIKEVQKVQILNKDLDELSAVETPDMETITGKAKELEQVMYDMITAKSETPISEVLDNVNTKQMQNFQKMFESVFAAN